MSGIREIIEHYAGVECRYSEFPLEFSLTFSLDESFDGHHELFRKISEFLTKLPARDDFLLTLGVDDSEKINFSSCCKDILIDTMSERIAHCLEDDSYVDVELKIRKSVSGDTLSIYDSKSFSRWIEESTLNSFLQSLKKCFEQRLFFESFDGEGYLATRTICIYPSKSPLPYSIGVLNDRSWRIDLFKESCFSTIENDSFIPEDFRVIRQEGYDAVSKVFDELSAILSVVFLANNSDLSGNRLSYTLKGQKLISGECSGEELVKSSSIIFKIYEWAYSESGADKIGLVRNVITIHSDSLESLCESDEVWQAILSNYQIYLKGNIETYLEIKSRVASVLSDLTSKSYSLVEGFLESLRNSIYVLVTFLISVVLINGLKDMDVKAVFSMGYFSVILIVSCVFLMWVWFARWEAIKRFNNSGDIMKGIIIQSYGDILSDSEIEASVNKVVRKNEDYLRQHSRKSSILFSVIVVVFVALYTASFALLNGGNDPSDGNVATEKINTLTKKESGAGSRGGGS